ncbi:MAG: GNAT family N-acetyltransferase [Thiotrichales bacterium]
MTIEISGPEKSDIASCESVLRSLPDYFGIEEALVQYLEDMKSRSTFHAYSDGRVVGFLTLTRHNSVSAEIHVMGVLPEEHKRIIGSGLAIKHPPVSVTRWPYH